MKTQETVRCFRTKCRRCGKPVLYWEGSAGSKVFFDFPVGERLKRHICQNSDIKDGSGKSSNKYVKTSYSEHIIFDPERISYQCPVCGKIFKKEQDLIHHIRIMSKNDDFHSDFFDNAADLIGQDFTIGSYNVSRF